MIHHLVAGWHGIYKKPSTKWHKLLLLATISCLRTYLQWLLPRWWSIAWATAIITCPKVCVVVRKESLVLGFSVPASGVAQSAKCSVSCRMAGRHFWLGREFSGWSASRKGARTVAEVSTRSYIPNVPESPTKGDFAGADPSRPIVAGAWDGLRNKCSLTEDTLGCFFPTGYSGSHFGTAKLWVVLYHWVVLGTLTGSSHVFQL